MLGLLDHPTLFLVLLLLLLEEDFPELRHVVDDFILDHSALEFVLRCVFGKHPWVLLDLLERGPMMGIICHHVEH